MISPLALSTLAIAALIISILAIAILSALVSPRAPSFTARAFTTRAFATLVIAACFISAHVIATAIASVLAAILTIAVELIVFLIIIGIIAIRRCRRALIASCRQAVTGRRGVKRCREALAHILYIDIGDRQFTTADAGPLSFGLCRNRTVIMLCMLQIVFSSDTVSDNAGIASHLQIFFQNLVGISADPNIRPITVVSLIALAHPTAVLTTHAMRLALAAPTTTANVVALFHHNVTSSFR